MNMCSHLFFVHKRSFPALSLYSELYHKYITNCIKVYVAFFLESDSLTIHNNNNHSNIIQSSLGTQVPFSESETTKCHLFKRLWEPLCRWCHASPKTETKSQPPDKPACHNKSQNYEWETKILLMKLLMLKTFKMKNLNLSGRKIFYKTNVLRWERNLINERRLNWSQRMRQDEMEIKRTQC